MQATLQLSAGTNVELRANRGPALPEPLPGWIVGHAGGKRVCSRIDWPEHDVAFPVTVLIFNRNQTKARWLKVILQKLVWKTTRL